MIFAQVAEVHWIVKKVQIEIRKGRRLSGPTVWTVKDYVAGILAKLRERETKKHQIYGEMSEFWTKITVHPLLVYR